MMTDVFQMQRQNKKLQTLNALNAHAPSLTEDALLFIIICSNFSTCRISLFFYFFISGGLDVTPPSQGMLQVMIRMVWKMFYAAMTFRLRHICRSLFIQLWFAKLIFQTWCELQSDFNLDQSDQGHIHIFHAVTMFFMFLTHPLLCLWSNSANTNFIQICFSPQQCATRLSCDAVRTHWDTLAFTRRVRFGAACPSSPWRCSDWSQRVSKMHSTPFTSVIDAVHLWSDRLRCTLKPGVVRVSQWLL